jgi:O-antigen/teichoic acid export membrane protein
VGVCFEQFPAFQLPSTFLTSFQTALTPQLFRWLENQKSDSPELITTLGFRSTPNGFCV